MSDQSAFLSPDGRFAMVRSSHVEALLGAETFAKVRDTKILVVGAGGIGCELLKNLVLVGFANIEIIDLDTIDLSNLNRQFLFRKPDISKSKALVAAATARHFNPSSGIQIHARHGNVKEAANDLEWIKGFGLVLNALDNMDARRHVNKLCQAGEVPLIESGTAGYMGQAMPIVKDKTECYDCEVKPAPKSYPVCTLRATPSEPIHCIVWAKTYLFGKLFGEDDEAVDEGELDKAKADGENAEEIENLKKEASAFRAVRAQLGEEDGPLRVFQKVFNDDINRLLQMEDMWKVAGRVKPVALDVGAINDGSFVTPPLRNAPPVQAPAAAGSGHTTSNGSSNGEAGPSTSAQTSSSLRDQRELSVKDNLDLFVDSCKRLSARSIAHPNVILSFDKDDDDTLDFVVATSNLRAIAYGIPKKTRFQVKEMAGNIIPAIATTNAVVAGFIVMQAVQILANPATATYNKFYLRQTPNLPVLTYPPVEPNPKCAVCRDVYIPFKVDPTKCTLGQFANDVVGEWLQSSLGGEYQWTIMEGGRILADPDDDGNYGRTLADLNVGRGQTLIVTDEDDEFRPIQFCLCSPDNSSEPYTISAEPPTIPRRPAKTPAPESDDDEPEAITDPAAPPIAPSAQKRPAPEDEEGSVTKKQKVAKADTTVVDDDDFEIL